MVSFPREENPMANVNVTAPTAEDAAAAQAKGTYTAVLHTNKGDITLELDGTAAPMHVANFVKLAQAGYYNGVTFHRVVPGFVIQAGDPTGTGSGGPGYRINFEQSPLKHIKGALGMARTNDPNSAGSQWYITLNVVPHLDGGYVVFGKTVAGLDITEKIQQGDVISSIDIS
jgi:cyclophilin family peptidyl-prolyl cis-trans isomerase